MKCFFIFAKVFYAKFFPKITIRESFCQKFRDFLISRKFLLGNVSAPKLNQRHRLNHSTREYVIRCLNHPFQPALPQIQNLFLIYQLVYNQNIIYSSIEVHIFFKSIIVNKFLIDLDRFIVLESLLLSLLSLDSSTSLLTNSLIF